MLVSVISYSNNLNNVTESLSIFFLGRNNPPDTLWEKKNSFFCISFVFLLILVIVNCHTNYPHDVLMLFYLNYYYFHYHYYYYYFTTTIYYLLLLLSIHMEVYILLLLLLLLLHSINKFYAICSATVSGTIRLNLPTFTVKLCCPMLPLHIV